MQKAKVYNVDLTKIKGGGEFSCPKCKVKISPEDETEGTYTVLESILDGDCLEKVIIQCNNCKSQIHLSGFGMLNKLK